MKILIIFILQAVIISLSFIGSHLLLTNPLWANLLAVSISVAIVIVLGIINLRNLSKARINKLVKEVTKNANLLGYTAGYMDSLSNQTDENSRQIFNEFNHVAQRASQEAKAIQEIANLVEKMSQSIQDIALGAQDQVKSVDSAAQITDKLNHVIENISYKADTSAKASSKAVEAANQGNKTTQEIIEAILKIRDTVRQSSIKVQDMGSRSKEIEDVMEKIKNIASQTNLLALNAAIEAAHAGKHGRGFAVVASEIRKLAENSTIATKEVDGLVHAIQTSVYEAMNAINMGIKEVEKGVEQANQSGKSLNEITTTAQTAFQESKEVVELAHQQVVETSQEVSTAMEAVSRVAQENSIATEKITAGSTNILNAMENISSVSKQNSTAAEGVAKLTSVMNDLITDTMASAQLIAELASSLQNITTPLIAPSFKPMVPTRPILADKRPTIGIIIPFTDVLFWKMSLEFARKGSDELGVDLVVRAADNQPKLMEKHLHDFVDRKVDGLIWVPYWGLGHKGLELTRDANIPVVIVDSYQSGLQPQSAEFPNYLVFIGPADESASYTMAKYLLKHMPINEDGKKYIAALDGPTGVPTAVLRHKGLLRALKEHPEAVVVANSRCDYLSEKAETTFAEILKNYPQIQGVWTANYAMTQGAMRAAKKSGKKLGKDICFVGMDLDIDSVEAVKNGDQLFDIGGHWLQIGFGLIVLYDHLSGHSIPKDRSIIKLTLLPLTTDRIKQYLRDYPEGLPEYNFRKNSLAYNPQATQTFMGIWYKD